MTARWGYGETRFSVRFARGAEAGTPRRASYSGAGGVAKRCRWPDVATPGRWLGVRRRRRNRGSETSVYYRGAGMSLGVPDDQAIGREEGIAVEPRGRDQHAIDSENLPLDGPGPLIAIGWRLISWSECQRRIDARDPPLHVFLARIGGGTYRCEYLCFQRSLSVPAPMIPRRQQARATGSTSTRHRATT